MRGRLRPLYSSSASPKTLPVVGFTRWACWQVTTTAQSRPEILERDPARAPYNGLRAGHRGGKPRCATTSRARASLGDDFAVPRRQEIHVHGCAQVVMEMRNN